MSIVKSFAEDKPEIVATQYATGKANTNNVAKLAEMAEEQFASQIIVLSKIYTDYSLPRRKSSRATVLYGS